MLINGPTDLFASLRLQGRNADVSRNLERAGQELATGRYSDLTAASGGDLNRLFALENSQKRVETRLSGVKLATARISAIQSALGGLEASTALGVGLLGSVGLGDIGSARHQAGAARSAFSAAVAALNTNFGGRALFGGAAVDAAPVADAELILADVAALAAAAPDTATALADIDFYFNDPAGGFAATRYLGSANDAPPVEIADDLRLAYAPRADNRALRGALHGLAIAAVAVAGAFPGDDQDELALYQGAGQVILAARQGVTDLRAALGVSEQRLEEAHARGAAERQMLQRAWNDIASRDPYEAASEFEALRGQLESIYVVTARLSQLSLVNFLR